MIHDCFGSCLRALAYSTHKLLAGRGSRGREGGARTSPRPQRTSLEWVCFEEVGLASGCALQ